MFAKAATHGSRGTPHYVRKGEGTPDPEACGNHVCIFCRANAKEEHGVGLGTSKHQTRTATGEFSTLPTTTRIGELSTREEGKGTVSPHDDIMGATNLLPVSTVAYLVILKETAGNKEMILLKRQLTLRSQLLSSMNLRKTESAMRTWRMWLMVSNMKSGVRVGSLTEELRVMYLALTWVRSYSGGDKQTSKSLSAVDRG